jgi:hypothetical protein
VVTLPADLDDETNYSDVDEDPDYMPAKSTASGNNEGKIDFTRRYSCEKRKIGKIDTSQSISRVLGKQHDDHST